MGEKKAKKCCEDAYCEARAHADRLAFLTTVSMNHYKLRKEIKKLAWVYIPAGMSIASIAFAFIAYIVSQS